MSTDEPRYTLEEAKQVLRRQQCVRFGHDWRIVFRGYQPSSLRCYRCGETYRVTKEGK